MDHRENYKMATVEMLIVIRDNIRLREQGHASPLTWLDVADRILKKLSCYLELSGNKPTAQLPLALNLL